MHGAKRKSRFLFFKLAYLACNVSIFFHQYILANVHSDVMHKSTACVQQTDQMSHPHNRWLEHFVMCETCGGVCTNTCDPCVIPPLQRSNPSACQIKTRCLPEVLMTAQPQNSTRRAGAGCARPTLGSSYRQRAAPLRRVGGLVLVVVGVFSLLLMC